MLPVRYLRYQKQVDYAIKSQRQQYSIRNITICSGRLGRILSMYIPEGRVWTRLSQPLVSGAQWQEQKQQAQTETQEVPPECKETCFHCDSNCTWDQVAQRGCGVYIHGDTQKLSGPGPEQLAPDEPASAGRVEKMTSRRPFQLQPPCDSVKIPSLSNTNTRSKLTKCTNRKTPFLHNK